MSNPHDAKDEDHGKDKQTSIVVNGRQKTVSGKEISFEQLVSLAFDSPPTGENILFTITYRRGEGEKPEGTLVAGDSVKVKDGMIFNVSATDKS